MYNKQRNFQPKFNRVVHSSNERCGNSTLKLCEAVKTHVVKSGKAACAFHETAMKKKNLFLDKDNNLRCIKVNELIIEKVRQQMYNERNENNYCKSLTAQNLPKKAHV